MLKLYNTLSQKTEDFTPIHSDRIGMYVCGPTVYDLIHIGNARPIVVYDLLFRLLKLLYEPQKKVIYVRNITDVDDKINNRAKEMGITIQELTHTTTEKFHRDIAALNVLPPSYEPKATEHINGMLEIIASLIEKKHAYVADGHVLFSVNSFSDYGSLSKRSIEEMLDGARVEVAPYKQYAGDFVLWKPSKEGEPAWDSPYSKGRPGWHIECSAMSKEYLGVDFDIHGGGRDLTFPHHENEIAQSRCAHDHSHYAKYWVHNGFVTVNGEKMAKSAGNFTTLRDLLDRGLSGSAIRYFLLSAQYSKPIDLNDKAINDAKISVNYLINSIKNVIGGEVDYKNSAVMQALLDDLNTPLAFAHMHELAKRINRDGDIEAAKELKFFCDLFGFEAEETAHDENYAKAYELALQRVEAKASKDYAKSDAIRADIEKLGYIIKDKPNNEFEIIKS